MNFPERIAFPRGCILWSRRTGAASDQDLMQFDITVDKQGETHHSPLGPRVVKFHTPCLSAENFSIAAAGMGAVNSFVWHKAKYNQAIKNMITEEQVEIVCRLFGFFSVHYSIPVAEIKTRAEYGQMKGISYTNPNGFYPKYWDFDGMGDELRSRIQTHREEILQIYPEF